MFNGICPDVPFLPEWSIFLHANHRYASYFCEFESHSVTYLRSCNSSHVSSVGFNLSFISIKSKGLGSELKRSLTMKHDNSISTSSYRII